MQFTSDWVRKISLQKIISDTLVFSDQGDYQGKTLQVRISNNLKNFDNGCIPNEQSKSISNRKIRFSTRKHHKAKSLEIWPVLAAKNNDQNFQILNKSEILPSVGNLTSKSNIGRRQLRHTQTIQALVEYCNSTTENNSI